MILAGLQTVPRDLYEAAEIDGATPWQQFWRITLPSIAGVIATAVLLRMIWVANSLDVILVMTGGGPGYATHTLPLYAFIKARTNLDFGYGSALAVIFTLLLAGFVLVYLRRTARAHGLMVTRSSPWQPLRPDPPADAADRGLRARPLSVDGADLAEAAGRHRRPRRRRRPVGLDHRQLRAAVRPHQLPPEHGPQPDRGAGHGRGRADAERHRRLCLLALPLRRAPAADGPVPGHQHVPGRAADPAAVRADAAARPARHPSRADHRQRHRRHPLRDLDDDQLHRRHPEEPRRGGDDRRLLAASARCGG